MVGFRGNDSFICIIQCYSLYIPKKIVFEPATEIKVTGIIGFLKRKVIAYGTGAKVTCPKEYLGKTVYLVIVDEPAQGIK